MLQPSRLETKSLQTSQCWARFLKPSQPHDLRQTASFIASVRLLGRLGRLGTACKSSSTTSTARSSSGSGPAPAETRPAAGAPGQLKILGAL